MSIRGDLADVTVPDLMQFICLGRRTGTLQLSDGRSEAEIGFRRGKIINALEQEAKPLGDLLLAQGVLDAAELRRALALQEENNARPPLTRVLLDSGIATLPQIRAAVEKQIQATVFRLTCWTRGRFEFVADELRPTPGLGLYPGDLVPEIELETPALVLEALRRFDEEQRDAESRGPHEGATASAERPKAGTPRDPIDSGLDAELHLLTGGGSPTREETVELPPLQVVSADVRFIAELAALCPDVLKVIPVELRDAGSHLPGEEPPFVLIDLRSGDVDTMDLRAVSRARPRACVLALSDADLDAAGLYKVGVRAVLPPNPEAVIAYLRTMLRDRGRPLDRHDDASDLKAGLAKLRRVVTDLRSGLLGGTTALNLMTVVSESAERAILFLVRKDGLAALGAFGFGATGESLALLTRGMVLVPGEDKVLTQAIELGRPLSVSWDAVESLPDLASVLGRPRVAQAVVLPVLGSSSVIALVYMDNGPVAKAIEEVEILELAAAQVGMAFENELLQRRLERSTAPRQANPAQGPASARVLPWRAT